MLSEVEIIIFDFWQTLADSELRPSDLFDVLILPGEITSDKFKNILFGSDLFLKNLELEESMSILLSDLNVCNQQLAVNAAISMWKKMARKAFLFQGAKELLSGLRNRGYKLCVLTNIDKFGHEHFPQSQIFDLFDYQLLSYSTGIAKPSLECWVAIKTHFKVEFDRMMMIGDSYYHDIVPAQRLGVYALLADFRTTLPPETMSRIIRWANNRSKFGSLATPYGNEIDWYAE